MELKLAKITGALSLVPSSPFVDYSTKYVSIQSEYGRRNLFVKVSYCYSSSHHSATKPRRRDARAKPLYKSQPQLCCCRSGEGAAQPSHRGVQPEPHRGVLLLHHGVGAADVHSGGAEHAVGGQSDVRLQAWGRGGA